MMYQDFAQIYDKIIEQDYEKWGDFIEAFLPENTSLILDLACGTGNITTVLRDRGYDMIGVDCSCEMLNIAMSKDTTNIQFLMQDITEFELYGTVDAIVCILDGINYVTEYEKLEKLFKLANNYLNPNGVFIFDISTKYKYEKVLGNNSFVREIEPVFYVWENEYCDNISTSFLNFFVEQNGVYQRFYEEHIFRAYETFEILKCSEKYFETVEICESLSRKKLENDSERATFVLRRKQRKEDSFGRGQSN